MDTPVAIIRGELKEANNKLMSAEIRIKELEKELKEIYLVIKEMREMVIKESEYNKAKYKIYGIALSKLPYGES